MHRGNTLGRQGDSDQRPRRTSPPRPPETPHSHQHRGVGHTDRRPAHHHPRIIAASHRGPDHKIITQPERLHVGKPGERGRRFRLTEGLQRRQPGGIPHGDKKGAGVRARNRIGLSRDVLPDDFRDASLQHRQSIPAQRGTQNRKSSEADAVERRGILVESPDTKHPRLELDQMRRRDQQALDGIGEFHRGRSLRVIPVSHVRGHQPPPRHRNHPILEHRRAPRHDVGAGEQPAQGQAVAAQIDELDACAGGAAAPVAHRQQQEPRRLVHTKSLLVTRRLAPRGILTERHFRQERGLRGIGNIEQLHRHPPALRVVYPQRKQPVATQRTKVGRPARNLQMPSHPRRRGIREVHHEQRVDPEKRHDIGPLPVETRAEKTIAPRQLQLAKPHVRHRPCPPRIGQADGLQDRDKPGCGRRLRRFNNHPKNVVQDVELELVGDMTRQRNLCKGGHFAIRRSDIQHLQV